ncbi:MAG: hypothetical protein K6G00_00395 [Treponema sp.]|nr:hypothetical protein [Treponema sp.]
MKKIFALLLCSFMLASLFAASMESRIRSVPGNVSSAAFKNPKAGLPMLVQNLTEGVNDDALKVKIIHDWICDNIEFDTQQYFSGKNKKQDYVSVLKKKIAMSEGYSSLMYEMCSAAGIEAVIVKGWSKGLGYSGKLERKPDHSWNAVKVGNEWKLVDVAWDAGIVEVCTWIKHYSTEWLFLAPENFIYSHLPEDESYQFLPDADVRTKDQFVKEPYIAGKFFESGISLTKNIPLYNTVITGETEYIFKVDPKTTVTSEIRDKNQNDVKNASWLNRSGNSLYFVVDVPDSADYKAMLFAKKADEDYYGFKFGIKDFEKNVLPAAEKLVSSQDITAAELKMFKSSFVKVKENDAYYIKEDLFNERQNENMINIFELIDLNPRIMETVLEFNVKADTSYKGFGRGVVKYPTTYNVYNNSTGTKLISPVCGNLKIGDEILFQVESSDFSDIAVELDGTLVNFEKNEKGIFELSVTIPEADTLKVYGSNNGHNYNGLWYYDIIK